MDPGDMERTYHEAEDTCLGADADEGVEVVSPFRRALKENSRKLGEEVHPER